MVDSKNRDKFLNLLKIVFVLLFFLFPMQNFAKVGDVYYCLGKSIHECKDGDCVRYKGVEFKFKRNEKSLKFGSNDNYFKNKNLVEPIMSLDSTEYFHFASPMYMEHFRFNNGKYIYSNIDRNNNLVVSTGTCDIF